MRQVIAFGLAAMMVVAAPAGFRTAGAAPLAGTISGVARDTKGGTLVNTAIRIRSARQGDVVSETRTDGGGLFSTPLQPGVYIIEAVGRSGRVIGVSPTVSVLAGRTAAVTVTSAAAQSPQALSQAGFSFYGLGAGASVGIAAAAAAAAITTVADTANDRPTPSPSQ